MTTEIAESRPIPKRRVKLKEKENAEETQLIDSNNEMKMNFEELKHSLEKTDIERSIENNLNKPDDPKDKVAKRRKRRTEKDANIKNIPEGEHNEAFEDHEEVINEKRAEVQHAASASGDQEKPRTKRRTRKKETKNGELSGLPESIPETPKEDQNEGEHEERKEQKEKKRTRRRKDQKAKSNEEEMEMHGNEAVPQQTEDDKTMTDDGTVVNVLVHRTDRLKTDINVLHPMVRVSIVDDNTGELLVKLNRDRKVVSYNEDIEKVSVILPVITQPFEFKFNKGTIPFWNESIVFDENSKYILNNSNVIIFFELLDLNDSYSIQKSSDGFRCVAWAFLRPNGANNFKNTGHKVRLQLYESGTVLNNERNAMYGIRSVYNWWRLGFRKPYPSTLYVTVSHIQLQRELDDKCMTGRSMFPHHPERPGRDDEYGFGGTKTGRMLGNKGNRLDYSALSEWARLSGQFCHVPNDPVTSLSAGAEGCSVLGFSPDGCYLACGTVESSEDYPVIIYNMFTGVEKPVGTYKGHNRLIHCLAWDPDSIWLATGSADGTCRLWKVGNKKQSANEEKDQNKSADTIHPTEDTLPNEDPTPEDSSKVLKKVLSHPCFIYSVQFHPHTASLVVTAGYDKVIRLWSVAGTNKEVLQTLDRHKGYINSVTFNKNGNQLYSGDSKGFIRVWDNKTDGSIETQSQNWILEDIIEEPDLKDCIINCIIMSPIGDRLFVHCRDGSIRVIDLKIKAMVLKFHRIVNSVKNIKSCLSPCGSFLFSGSEDISEGSKIYVWNAQTGEQMAIYKDINLKSEVSTIDYHPKCHLIAFSGIGPDNNVLIYGYNSKKHKREVSIEEYDSSGNLGLEFIKLKGKKPLQSKGLTGIGDTGSFESTLQQSSYENRDDRFARAVKKINSVKETEQTLRRGTKEMELMSSGSLMNSSLPGNRGRAMRAFNQGSQVDSIPMTLTATDTGKANFTFKLPISVRNTEKNKAYLGEVRALYDYKAERADELTFVKGEVIKIRFKDGNNWLLGETEDGTQGYVRVNYVDAADLIFSNEVSLLEETNNLDPNRSVRFQDDMKPDFPLDNKLNRRRRSNSRSKATVEA